MAYNRRQRSKISPKGTTSRIILPTNFEIVHEYNKTSVHTPDNQQ